VRPAATWPANAVQPAREGPSGFHNPPPRAPLGPRHCRLAAQNRSAISSTRPGLDLKPTSSAGNKIAFLSQFVLRQLARRRPARPAARPRNWGSSKRKACRSPSADHRRPTPPVDFHRGHPSARRGDQPRWKRPPFPLVRATGVNSSSSWFDDQPPGRPSNRAVEGVCAHRLAPAIATHWVRTGHQPLVHAVRLDGRWQPPSVRRPGPSSDEGGRG